MPNIGVWTSNLQNKISYFVIDSLGCCWHLWQAPWRYHLGAPQEQWSWTSHREQLCSGGTGRWSAMTERRKCWLCSWPPTEWKLCKSRGHWRAQSEPRLAQLLIRSENKWITWRGIVVANIIQSFLQFLTICKWRGFCLKKTFLKSNLAGFKIYKSP